MTGGKKHIPYFDFLKGIAILMVVGIHTYKMDNDSIITLKNLLINISNCAVPLFLALSGYFIGKRNFSNFSQISNFWKKQIKTVYVPCLVFSLPWLIISCRPLGTNWGGVYNPDYQLFHMRL